MALTAKKVYAILKRQISDMEAKLNSPVRYRGTVATADLLPLNPDIGDMYNIESKSVYGEAGMNVAWNGVVWDTMGAPIDMSLYIKSNELADWVKQQNKPAYTAEEVGALPADTKIPSKTSELKNDSGFLTKVPDGYLNGTDATLKESGKAADAKATGDKFTEMSADISKKLDKNQGSENSGKIAGINESGDIVPMFPVGVEYNEETNCLEFGADQKMKLNQGIGLDSSLTKIGYAADAGVVGEVTSSLKESISTKITKFYASSQGETHLADSDNGKIMDMMLYGRSEQKQYSGCQLIDFSKGTYFRNATGSILNDTITVTAKDSYSGIWFPISLEKVMGNKIILTAKKSSQSNSEASISIRITVFTANEKKYVSLSRAYDVPDNATSIVVEIIANNSDTRLDISNTVTVEGLQLQIGSEQLGWEPYTGGIPSPNPDYPQEIKSVVNLTVKVCGKNLIPPITYSGNISGLQIDVKEGLVRLKGTPNAEVNYPIFGKWNVTSPTLFTLHAGSYTVSGCGTTLTNPRLNLVYLNDGQLVSINGNKAFTLDKDTNFIAVFVFADANKAVDITFTPMIEKGSTPTSYEPYHEQTVTLPYTLNAIPVSSGGNVTIDGQQYVSDYFDVERGKLVQRIWKGEFDGSDDENWIIDTEYKRYYILISAIGDNYNYKKTHSYCNRYKYNTNVYLDINHENGFVRSSSAFYFRDDNITDLSPGNLRAYLAEHPLIVMTILEKPIETDLTSEEIAALKALATYYPVTNISVNSEQLDGYTVFNYPISMQNGWNYVKKQIGDTRDYIYDMDARTQDTDLQAAEAYINSEYAVALTELEV